MKNIDRNYVLIAFAWLVIGIVFGFWMGATGNLQYVSLHVGMLMTGFVTHAICGFAYRLWPEMKGNGLAMPQFWLTAAATPVMVIGAWINLAQGSIVVIALASAVFIVGAAIMAWLFWRQTKPA